jgi:hypothetical protein
VLAFYGLADLGKRIPDARKSGSGPNCFFHMPGIRIGA